MSKVEYTIDPGKQEILLTRTFAAPRELVFQTINDPDLIPRWWGPRWLETRVDEMDVRAGGKWRYVHSDSEGRQYGFHGVYHDVHAPERLVLTFEYEGEPGHAQLLTIRLEEVEGGTRLTQQSVFQSVADRDGMVQAGMEKGGTDMMDRLEELLAAVKV